MGPWKVTMTGTAEPERLDGQRVSASYFQALGVAPAIGRDFDPADDRTGGPNVAILSDGLWRRRFRADLGILGREITLDDNSYTVIGVMPSQFENVPAPSAQLWRLLQYDKSLPSLQGREWGHHLRLVARLRPGLDTDQAVRELDAIAQAPVPEFARPPWAAFKNGLIVNSLKDDVTRGVKPALLAVLGAVMLVLLIACVNVTNLLLAQGAQRRVEFALRAALGAARLRMIRQLITESLLLSLLGGAVGMLVADFGISALVALSPGLPRLNAIQIDSTVFAFALGITALIGLMVGLVPALHAFRGELYASLQQSSNRTAGGHQFTRRVLVVCEVALALVLLVSAGLMLRSLETLFAISPGFDSSSVLTLQVQTSQRQFDKDAAERFFTRALEAVRQVAGVESAALTSQLPMSADRDQYGAHFEGDAPNVA